MSDRLTLIGEAQRKGFAVVADDDGTGWLIAVPARPRNPMHTLGTFSTPDRAWMAACLISRDWAIRQSSTTAE